MTRAGSLRTLSAGGALAVASLLAVSSEALAGKADVVGVQAVCTTIRTCDFHVKVLHADIGWSHYADQFEVVTPDGEVLGTRVLRHPHVHEQPFVRGLVGVEIPEGVDEVIVRARDSKHGLGGKTVTKHLEFPEQGHAPGAPGTKTDAGESPPGDAH